MYFKDISDFMSQIEPKGLGIVLYMVRMVMCVERFSFASASVIIITNIYSDVVFFPFFFSFFDKIA